MLTSQRKSLILDMLRQEGQVVAKRAAEEFSLSEDTIRRDLREMAAEGLLRRVHGGAMPASPDLPDFSARRVVSSDVKQRLGKAAADMVKPGQTIFLDGGTSTAEIARALPRDFRFTVVTHSPTIAADLEHHPTAEVILIGGKLYKHSMVATGAAAMAQIALMRPDIFFLGITAAHPVRGLSTGDFEEAAIKRHIAACSMETITLVTAEKLDAVSPHVIMPVSGLSGMIVQEGIEEERLAPYRAVGVHVAES
ncbi:MULTISPECIES: DeoR/GlpR family DNA-binding transcription regulator [unclassified Neorhizobium]|uniref:DeoR/GlpR family DNA-binding transcription regulator n=1 Tax=unclassified Neorhizobium TaxID=2629175 RepID=UPI001FF17812|nr:MULTISPECIES: DeoR/GlpR family DNA-binding transcription regulator [unclassified Neorhizobium]MCJ9672373.1 DeoR/GlpR family DNA-binding transcription regulator [Neorhizobium sp. SHOUNA12B]MCJ9745467.1 DeoR/GlpR family DNA-binding transcription regulator [Neorhizobium sp. SHOUNA12A]